MGLSHFANTQQKYCWRAAVEQKTLKAVSKKCKQQKWSWSLTKFCPTYQCFSALFSSPLCWWTQLRNTTKRWLTLASLSKNHPKKRKCPWSAFKNPGLHYSTEIFKKSTFEKEEIFMNITDLSPFNESLYEIEEIKSVFMGRCYMVCPLQPQKKLTLDYLALKNDKEIEGCLSLLLRSDIGPACFTCQIILENV